MKKIVLSLAVLALGYSAQAQEGFGFKQGDILLEGSIRYKSSDNKETSVKTDEFNFTPQAGYFITDKFAAGLYFDLMTGKVDNYSLPTTNTVKSNEFNVGVFGRYYFLELGQRFKFYGQANLGFANSKVTTEAGGFKNDVKGSGVNVGADLGVNYFVTPKIAINFAFANLIDYTTTKPKGGKAQNDFNLNINNFNNFFDAATFGLTFKF